MKSRLKLDCLEPVGVYFYSLNEFGSYAEAEFFKRINKLVAINEIDWWCTVTSCFGVRARSKTTSSDKQPLLRATHHGATEIPDFCGANTTRVALRLENNRKAKQACYFDDAMTINAAVARPAGNLNLNEARFPEQPLT